MIKDASFPQRNYDSVIWSLKSTKLFEINSSRVESITLIYYIQPLTSRTKRIINCSKYRNVVWTIKLVLAAVFQVFVSLVTGCVVVVVVVVVGPTFPKTGYNLTSSHKILVKQHVLKSVSNSDLIIAYFESLDLFESLSQHYSIGSKAT